MRTWFLVQRSMLWMSVCAAISVTTLLRFTRKSQKPFTKESLVPKYHTRSATVWMLTVNALMSPSWERSHGFAICRQSGRECASNVSGKEETFLCAPLARWLDMRWGSPRRGHDLDPGCTCGNRTAGASGTLT